MDRDKLMKCGYVDVRAMTPEMLQSMLDAKKELREYYKQAFGEDPVDKYDWFIHIKSWKDKDYKIERVEKPKISLNPFKL